MVIIKLILILLFGTILFAAPPKYFGKDAFTNVTLFIPEIHYDMRYAQENNFVGSVIEGYQKPLCLLSHESALALKKVEVSLQKEGLTLKVFDCYRPQQAVDHFVRWAKDLNDTKMKRVYYPHVKKEVLFKEGYIAARSGHSRGSTVDLTIDGLNMGTPFDFFDPRSHTLSTKVTKKQHHNRMLLRKVMEAHGFKNYSAEWWHYTLKEEPFKEHYFDFVVK